MCLATMAYVYTPRTVCVTIFSTGSKFQLVSELRALTPATHSLRSCMHDPHSNIDIKCTVTVTSLRGPLDKSHQKEAVMYHFLSVLRTHSVTVVYAQTVHSFISWNHVWGDQKTISFCCYFHVFFTACLIIKMHEAINTMCIACMEDFEGWWLSNCRSSVVKYWQLLGG